MEFNDGYPSYEEMALHDEEHGKKVRKAIWKVFWILLIVTLVELVVGFQAQDWNLGRTFLMVFFISLTIVKAAYIVMSFMHLGHEVKSFQWTVLGPFAILILYLVFLVDPGEGTYSKSGRYAIDKNLTTHTHQSHTPAKDASKH